MADSKVVKGLDQRRVDYRAASTLAVSCAECAHFDGDGYCRVVSGPIRPDYVCDKFLVADSPQARPRMTSDGGVVFDMASDVAISKADDDEQLVFGWANIALAADGTEVVDSHGDSIPPADLELAAYEFVLNYGLTGDQHDGGVTGRLVESFYLSEAKAEALGLASSDLPRSGWWVGFHIEDRAVYDMVKSGDRPMFSIQGHAVVEPVEASDA